MRKTTANIDHDDEHVGLGVVRCTPDGAATIAPDTLQREHLFEIVVDGTCFTRTRCTLGDLDELVFGRLLTAGVIESVDDVEALSVERSPLRADVTLRRPWPPRDGAYDEDGLPGEGLVAPSSALAPVEPIPWTLDEAFAMARVFDRDRTSHSRTRGVHSAYLFHAGRLALVREDIGRHNAFDKAVGAALLAGINLRACALFTSGRVPTDMTVKAVRAGIPIVVSKAAATAETARMAKAYRLTLLCKTSPASLDVVCDPLGVALSALEKHASRCA